MRYSYNVYQVKFTPEPEVCGKKEGFDSEEGAKNYTNNPEIPVYDHTSWMIVKIPAEGNVFELIECYPTTE